MTCGPTGAQGLAVTSGALSSGSAYTVSMWLRQTAATTGQAWTLFKTPGGGDYIALSSVGAVPKFWVDGGTLVTIPGGNLTLNAWEAFCLSYDGAGTVKIYRSQGGAALALQLTQAVSYAGNADSSYYMNDESLGSTSRWRGQAGFFKEWQAALSLAELQHETFKAWPSRTANLLRFLPCLKNATAATDFSGRGGSATKTGTLTDVATSPPLRWRGREIQLQD